MKVTIDGVEYVPALRPLAADGSLGDALRRYRTAAKLSLEEASKAAECSKSYLWELEQNRSMPGLDMACRISRVYGAPLDLLGACAVTHNTGAKAPPADTGG